MMSAVAICALSGAILFGQAGGAVSVVGAQARVEPIIDPGLFVALDQTGGQTVRTWVFFTDKGALSSQAREQALADVAAGYHPKAIARRSLRRMRPGLFDDTDLPVHRPYVDQVLGIGVSLRTTSTWLNAISIEADLRQVNAIAVLPFVRLIKPLARSHRIDLGLETPGGPDGGSRGGFYGYAEAQLEEINLIAAHSAGYTGAGVIVGILDTGFKRTHEAYNEPGHEVQVLGEWDVINDDGDTSPEPGDPSNQHWHGSAILSTIGAYKPNVMVGGAYDAAFYLAKTEDISMEEPIEEDYYVAGLQWIEANGGDVATSSLSYYDWYTQDDLDGVTATTTIGVNVATDNGVACCTAASNRGHDNNPDIAHLGAPADAFDVLTCGAVNSSGTIASFSSDGPTADGRLKPEVLARGVSAWTINPNNDTGYITVSGTSLSTPIVAAATAVVIQAHPDWTVKQIRSAYMQTASDYLANGEPDPLFIRGYGIIDVMAAIEMSFVGDVDRDGDTDLDDLAMMDTCLTGPGVAPTPECQHADLDEDNDVDVNDFSIYQRNFTGSWPE